MRKLVTENKFVAQDCVPLFRLEKNPDLDVEDRRQRLREDAGWQRLREDAGCLMAERLDDREWVVSFHEEATREDHPPLNRLTITVRVALLDWRQAEVGEWVHRMPEDVAKLGRPFIDLIVPLATTKPAPVFSEIQYEKRAFEHVGRYWRRIH